MFALLDTSSVPIDLRYYLPLLLETILESPIRRDGQLISHEDVITELNNDTISNDSHIGTGSRGGRFSCGPYSNTAVIFLQVEAAKYEKGINWLREILYQTVLTPERLKIMANKMVNDVAQAKRQGRSVVSYVMKGIRYIEGAYKNVVVSYYINQLYCSLVFLDSNPQINGILKQHKFLLKVMEKLETAPQEIIENMEKLKNVITEPANVALYFAGNLDMLKPTAAKAINDFLPQEIDKTPQQRLINSKFVSRNSSDIFYLTIFISRYNS